jgi:hypothetical protein
VVLMSVSVSGMGFLDGTTHKPSAPKCLARGG